MQTIFLHVSETVHFELTDKSSIEDFEKEEYESDMEEESNSNEDDSNASENMDIEL